MPPKSDADDEAFRLMMDAPDDDRPARAADRDGPAPRRPAPVNPLAADAARAAFDRTARQDAPTRTPPRRPRDEDGERRGGISISPAVGTGLLMVLGGALWLGVGLAAGRLFFYPIILVVLGLAAVVKGLLGFGED